MAFWDKLRRTLTPSLNTFTLVMISLMAFLREHHLILSSKFESVYLFSHSWGSMGIDLSASYVVQSAATLTENGGVANGGFSGGGPGSSPPGTPGAATTLVCTVVS